MTQASVSLVPHRSPESVLNSLRAEGLRISTARRLVVHTLFAAERPLSAEEIASATEGTPARLDLASVYRNLEVLECLGFVHHVRLGSGPGRYLLSRGEEREYLACERCGTLVELDPRELDAARADVRERFGYAVRFTHFPMVGTCEACRDPGELDPLPSCS
jgi:Fur family ferric uptake transcriptional regulator